MNPVLIIGRFQPLCLNHADLFSQAKNLGELLLIGVGQPNYELAKKILPPKNYKLYELSYLFGYEKVKGWIDESLKDYYHLVKPVKDLFNKSLYQKHVESIFGIKKAILLGENESTYSCFNSDNYEIIITKLSTNYHASDARKEILNQGFSNKVAVKLTQEELEKIIKSETLRTLL
ncbi:MAG: hypothetical protein WC376_00430 [Candidatus Nanoarchaeia archaeon]|jgi:hypothetical protein